MQISNRRELRLSLRWGRHKALRHKTLLTKIEIRQTAVGAADHRWPAQRVLSLIPLSDRNKRGGNATLKSVAARLISHHLLRAISGRQNHNRIRQQDLWFPSAAEWVAIRGRLPSTGVCLGVARHSRDQSSDVLLVHDAPHQCEGWLSSRSYSPPLTPDRTHPHHHSPAGYCGTLAFFRKLRTRPSTYSPNLT